VEGRAPEVVAIVKKLKDRAKASPWMPSGLPPPVCYYHLPDGLSLCFTLDLFTKEYLNRLARAIGAKAAGELGEGGQFWHLSIARMGAQGPNPGEVEFWRGAFFGEAPAVEVPGLIPGLSSRHFFWRAG